jgi:hypothetical protein
MQYLGIDWGTRKAAWCALDECGHIAAEGAIPADEDGLARLVARLGPDVRGCLEMMSGAAWVRDRLQACGWIVEIANARKVKAVAPLACKTDRIDARGSPSWRAATSSPRSGCRRSMSGRCASCCAGACTWCACAPRPSTAASDW